MFFFFSPCRLSFFFPSTQNESSDLNFDIVKEKNFLPFFSRRNAAHCFFYGGKFICVMLNYYDLPFFLSLSLSLSNPQWFNVYK
jgi:hypothetical protein